MRVVVAQNDPAVPIGTLASPLKDHGIHLTVWPAWAPPPLTLSGYAALIVLGGAANPDQDTQFPGLEHQRRLLREALDRGVPVLGSCLGAQLLAQVLAGQIGPLPHPEIGWVPVQACKAADDDPLYRTLPPLMHAFDWHTYGFSLPSGARLLATSPTAPQAFRFGACAWGLQFHLEADEGIIRGWITRYEDQLCAACIDPGSLARETSQRADLHRRQAVAFGRAFASVVERTATYA